MCERADDEGKVIGEMDVLARGKLAANPAFGQRVAKLRARRSVAVSK
jgi:hypothetical protein